MSAAGSPLCVIVFAYNEAENIAHVLGELRGWLEQHEPGFQLVRRRWQHR